MSSRGTNKSESRPMKNSAQMDTKQYHKMLAKKRKARQRWWATTGKNL